MNTIREGKAFFLKKTISLPEIPGFPVTFSLPGRGLRRRKRPVTSRTQLAGRGKEGGVKEGYELRFEGVRGIFFAGKWGCGAGHLQKWSVFENERWLFCGEGELIGSVLFSIKKANK